MALFIWGLKLKISGSIYEDYKWQIEPGDQGFVNKRFIDSVTSLGMQTFPVYDEVPKYMVMGATYAASELVAGVSPKTMAPLTKTQFLFAHDMCVNLDNGLITSVASMAAAPWKRVTGSNGAILANHIPAVFSIYPDGVVSSVFGQWNAATNSFIGNVEFITPAELLERKDAIITG